MEGSGTLTRERRKETDHLEPGTVRHTRAAEMTGPNVMDWAYQPPLSPEMEQEWADIIEHTYGSVDQE